MLLCVWEYLLATLTPNYDIAFSCDFYLDRVYTEYSCSVLLLLQQLGPLRPGLTG